MKKHEALKHAYDTYPKGTKVLVDAELHEVTGIYTFINNTGIYDDNNTLIYDGLEWIDKANNSIEIKQPLIISEDGFEMFEGDRVIVVWHNDNEWRLLSDYKIGGRSVLSLSTFDDKHKVFASKENAEKWIEEMNKPKDIEVTKSITVSKDRTIIQVAPSITFCIVSEELEEIYTAYKSLQS